MAVVVLTSTKGSPGVSSTALGVALVWPRPVVLIEADPDGGGGLLAGHLRGTRNHDSGIIDVALAHGLGESAGEALDQALQPLTDRVRFLSGPAGPAQAAGVAEAWAPAGDYLRSLHHTGVDVIIDYGRASNSRATALLRSADLVLVVLGSDLPAVAAARAGLPTLLAEAGRGGAPVEALLIGPGRPYGSREIAAAIDLRIAANLPWNPRGAAVLSHGEPGNVNWRRYERSLRACADQIRTALRRSPVLERSGGQS